MTIKTVCFCVMIRILIQCDCVIKLILKLFALVLIPFHNTVWLCFNTYPWTLCLIHNIETHTVLYYPNNNFRSVWLCYNTNPHTVLLCHNYITHTVLLCLNTNSNNVCLIFKCFLTFHMFTHDKVYCHLITYNA